DLLVSSFLKAVEFDRLLQQRIGDLFAVAQNAQTGLALGLYRDVPDRQAYEAVARLKVEFRPIDNRRLVGGLGVEQHSAEISLLGVAAGKDWSGSSSCPYSSGTVGRRDHRLIRHEPA